MNEEYVGWLDSDWNIVLDQSQPIVRCRDCLSWLRGMCRKHVFTITVDGTEYDEGAFPVDANDFCSLGELKGDAE